MKALKKISNTVKIYLIESTSQTFYKKKFFKTKILKPKFDYSNFRYTLDYPKDMINIKKIYKYLKKNNLSGTTIQIVKFLKSIKST